MLRTAAPSSPPSAPTVSGVGWLMIGALGVIWGGAFFATEIALGAEASPGLSPFALAAHRVAWAALALWLYIVWRRIPLRRDGAPLSRSRGRLLADWAMMGLLNNAAPFSLIMWGQTTLEGGLASIFNAMTAVFGVLVAAALVPGERLSQRKLGGVALGVLGVGVLTGGAALSALDPRSLAQLAVLTAAFSYALASAWGRLRLSGLSHEWNAAGMLSAATLWTLPGALWFGEGAQIPPTAEIWAATLSLALVATAAAYLLYFAILSVAGAGNAMLVTLVVPPVAMALGAAFLGEVVTPAALLGFGLIALALVVIDGRWLFRR